MAITLEISCCKFPNAQSLPNFWRLNLTPLLGLLSFAQKGLVPFLVRSILL